MSKPFRALQHRNYRLWASGAIVSNTGTWMQRTAQDWLVLAVLTDHSALALGAGWTPPADRPLPDVEEGHSSSVYREQPPRVLAVDSASQIGPGLERDIVLTGSHGGAVGGVGVKAPVAAAFFNDAGVGKDDAGLSRLPLLDKMGIPGMTVSSDSARIGFADETYRRGVVSSVNDAAAAAGVRVGMTARAAAAAVLAAIGRG